MSMDAFWRVYSSLPQAGPGSDATTLEALRRLQPWLPASPRVLDLGCGPGRQTLALARALGSPITAVDINASFLQRLEADAATQGLGHLVNTRCADFGSLEEPPAEADLLWSEGSIYHLGWVEGLRRWRPLLKPGGVMAITEATWLTDSPPAEIADFWREVYPAMGTVASNMALARQAGLGVIDTLPLSASDWWEGYFGPLQERVAFLREQAREDWVLAAVLDDAERESALYARHGSTYGYVFYLLSVPGPT
ncbi:class I SAM-dependent methyltransferase [Archangium gephyra]|nr:class I SAM-dependent methyltransferase [Archangium gephyra]